MNEWKKAIRTDIYNYKKEARKFFSLENVVRESIHLYRQGSLTDPYYIDFDLILNDPYNCKVVSKLYASIIKEIFHDLSTPRHTTPLLGFIEKFGGATIGAIRLSGYISALTGIENVPIRLGKLIETEQIKTNPFIQKINTTNIKKLHELSLIIVTDHITTGREILNVVDVIEYNGGKVDNVVAYTARMDKETAHTRDKKFKEKNIQLNHVYDVPQEFPEDIKQRILTQL